MDHGRHRSVIVVGAGPAGLATSRELVRLGVDHVVLERGEIGESWRRYYDSLVLHTGRHLSSLPGVPFERADPLFVPRDRFVRYLVRYADTLGLPVRAGVAVTSVRHETDHWELETTEGGWRGRALVVGAGNSGGEIAAELARVVPPVAIAIRSGVVVVPRTVLGIPSQYLGMLIRRLPRVVVAPLIAAATRFRASRLPAALPRSSASPLDEIPLIGMHLPDAIRSGRVRVRPGVAGFDRALVRFADGTSEPFDEVIMATGFRAAIEWLGDLVGRDGRGFARRTDRVTSSDQAGLFFVGHEYDASGGLVNIRHDAPIAAKRAAAWLAGSRPTSGAGR